MGLVPIISVSMQDSGPWNGGEDEILLMKKLLSQ